MVHYVYRILYSNPDGAWPLIYIGSWHHEFPGRLDTNYHGSSGVAKRLGLRILKEEILIDGIPSDYASVVESACIAQEANMYGWYQEGGRVINRHCMFNLRGPSNRVFRNNPSMLVEVYKNGSLLGRGSLNKVCFRIIDKPKWINHVHAALQNSTTVSHLGYTFKLIRNGHS